MSSTDSVKVTTLVDVDAPDAFRLFTEDVDVWWKRGPRYRRSGQGTLRFDPPRAGGSFLEIVSENEVYRMGKILHWEEGKRLVFELGGRDFQPGETTEVEVRFEPEGAKTRVVLEHRGFDALGPDHPVRHGHEGEAFIGFMGLWWADLLVSIRSHAASSR